MSDEAAKFLIEIIDRSPATQAAKPGSAPTSAARPSGPVQAAQSRAAAPVTAARPATTVTAAPAPVAARRTPATSQTTAATPPQPVQAAPPPVAAAAKPAPPRLPGQTQVIPYRPAMAPPPVRQPIAARPPSAGPTAGYPANPSAGRGIISLAKGAGGKAGAMAEAAGLTGAGAGGGAAGPIGAALMMIGGAIGGALKDNAQLIGAGSVGEHGGGAVAASVALDAIKKLPGPLKHVVGVFETVGDMANAAFDQLAKNVKHFGAVAANVVRGDFIEAAAKRYEKIAEEKSSTLIGKLTGAGNEAKLRAASLRSYQEVDAALKGKTEQLRPYSGEIISAQTSAQVATMMERQRQARAIGGAMASHVTHQTAFNLAAEQLSQKQANKLANAAAAALKSGNIEGFQRLSGQIEKLSDLSAFAGDLAKDQSEEGKRRHKEFVELIRENLRQLQAMNAKNAPENMVQDLLADLKFLNPLPPKDEMMDNPNWAQQAMIGPLVIND